MKQSELFSVRKLGRSGLISFEGGKGSVVFLGQGYEKVKSNLSFGSREETHNFVGVMGTSC